MPLATAASLAGPICPLSDAEIGNVTLDAPSKDEVTEKKNGKNNKLIHDNFIIISKCYLIAGKWLSNNIWSDGIQNSRHQSGV
jgi:hypothetical protein